MSAYLRMHYPQCVFLHSGGAGYLLYLSRSLAATCGVVCALLWLVALRYGAFQRRSQRLYQNVLADTNQVPHCLALLLILLVARNLHQHER